MNFIKIIIIILISLTSCSSSPLKKKSDRPPIPLSCDYTRKIFKLGVTNHIDFSKETKELENRVLKSFIYRIDPNKTLTLEKEINELKKLAGKHSLFKDLKAKCKKILPSFYINFLKASKRYTEKIIKFASTITQKQIENFKLSDHPEKYDSYAKTIDELDNRIKLSTMRLFKYLKATDVSFKTVKENFIKDSKKALDKVNTRIKEASGDAELQHEKYEFILSAFINALDAHSTYIPYSYFMQNEEEFNKGFFFGIGILIGKEKYKGIKVKEVYKNGPAGKEGTLKTGDIIFKVNGTNVIDLPLEDGVKLIKGPKGTKVKLEFIRTMKDEIKKMSVTLVRNKVFFTESIKVKLIKKDNKKIALIELDQFFRNAASGVFQKYLSNIGATRIDGILLDLTQNGGGLLTEAIELTDLFIGRGPVVATKDANNKIKILPASTPGELANSKVPMVVLVNKVSASASEIVAGALKDYNRAIIVGQEQTFGKGSVQDVIPILGGKMGGLHITIAKFFRPGGHSTQLRGIPSDIILPGLLPEDFQGEKDQLFPVSFETISPLIGKKARYKFPYKEYIPQIAAMSEKRVAKNKIFAELKKDRSDIDYELFEKEKPFIKEGLAILIDYINLSKTRKSAIN